MNQYTFLPMSIDNDQVTVEEPFASKISEKLSRDILSFKANHVDISMKNIQEKEAFVDNIASSIKKMQKDMINSYLTKNTMRYL